MAARGSGPLTSAGGSTELDRLRTIVSQYFPVYETRVGPQSVLLAVHVDPATLATKFDRLRRELWTLQYVPLLRRHGGEEFIEVVRRPALGRSRLWVNILLLLGTIGTTAFAGSLLWLTWGGAPTLGWSDLGYGALYFGLPVMTILGLHELAHYLVARHHHVEATLPYFIPIPPPFLFGTFGAFISIREPFPDRKALFDIGAAGPLAGFAASIPIALVGLYLGLHPPVVPLSYCGPTILGVSYGNLLIGTPPFWSVLQLFFPPSLVAISPLALAGWVGIFVTAINLLPASQLDGGHVWRALLGDNARFLSYAIVGFLLIIGILFYYGWLIFAFLILFLGVRHPPPLNDATRLDTKRVAVGICVGVVLVAGFALTPIATAPGTVHIPSAVATSLTTPPPGAAVAANLTVQLVNGDPEPHGFVFATTVENVSLRVNNSTEYLTGLGLAAWAANATWVYHLPNGTALTLTGNEAYPTEDFVTVPAVGGANSVRIVVTLSNTESTLTATVAWTATEFCAPSGAGTASSTLTAYWP
ncbi:MAG: site-2 protease family protein [Thermoplasmata archaeon]